MIDNFNFRWLSYEVIHWIFYKFLKSILKHRPRWMWNRKFDSDFDERLLGYGSWHIVNEFHIEKFQINFHCTFALNSKYGTVICAVKLI